MKLWPREFVTFHCHLGVIEVVPPLADFDEQKMRVICEVSD